MPLTQPLVMVPGQGQGDGAEPDQALHPSAVRRAALALANHSATMPEHRVTALQVLQHHSLLNI